MARCVPEPSYRKAKRGKQENEEELNYPQQFMKYFSIQIKVHTKLMSQQVFAVLLTFSSSLAGTREVAEE